MSKLTTNELWRDALVIVQNHCEEYFSEHLFYDIKTMYDNHCCPPPIKELQLADHTDEKGTDTLWRGRRAVWCYPATPKEGAALKEGEKIPVGCLGCTLWAIIHALKLLGLEDQISQNDIETLKKMSLQEKLAFAPALEKLGWSSGYFTDPDKAQGGDLGIIGYGDELAHHWFVVAEDAHIEVKGNKALNTWSGSPMANGAGFDYWYKDKSNSDGKRYFVLCRPFV